MPTTVQLASGTTEPPPGPPQAKLDLVRSTAPALAALSLLAITLVVMTWLGARMVRRRISKPLPPMSPVGDEWYGKPLVGHRLPPHKPRPPADE